MKEHKTKRCAKCGKELPLSEFHKNRHMKDGLHYYCKKCAIQIASIQYIESDYLLKKYLKRYEESLAFARKRKAEIDKKRKNGECLTSNDRLKERRAQTAIAKWIEKIHEVTQRLDKINRTKTKTEATIIEKPNIMNKKQLIQLLESVPDHAQIIYVGDQESKSALVATWKPSADTTIVRNIKDNMPFIFAEGKLFELVSAQVGETDSAKEA